ncbi:MAG: ABC transporter permease [Tissierellia bacterium]|nr:ABC transporter permease [Tissierellia bacterium]
MKKQNKLVITMFSILMGLLFGSIVLLISGINPLEAYMVIIKGSLGRPKYISWVIIKAVPIIMTGISVAFAFKTGLFNIGAEGQYTMGAIGAVIAGVYLDLPPILHVLFVLIFGIIFGGIWGALVGYFKAKFKVHEVISSIMLNWIAFYFNNFILDFSWFRLPESESSYYIKESASIKLFQNWKASEAGREVIANNKLIKDILSTPVNLGIVFAILVAFAMWYILKHTTTGYQLKAVGYNRDAAEYGGINIRKNIVFAMMISGALSGLAGALQVAGVSGNVFVLPSQLGYGFDGIAVSLIAGNSPIACIFSGLFYSALMYGGGKLNSALKTPSEIINIILGIIVLFISMPKIVSVFKEKLSNKKLQRGENNE